jgi:hypothetical protein
MPDIVTSKTFVDGEKGITAAKLNQIISGAVIQPAFYSAKPSSATLDPTDVLLELKGTGAYAQITGAQVASSVAGQLALADTTQNGMLRKVSGLTTDFVDGTNNCQDLASGPALTAMRLRSFSSVGNPTFEVDQRNVGAALTNPAAGTFIQDRWMILKSALTGTVNTSLRTGLVLLPGTNFAISNNFQRFTVGTAQAVLAAADYYVLRQNIEGPKWRELSSDVHSISILVRSSVAGLAFAVSLEDQAASHSLVQLCTIPTANVWTLVTLPNLAIWSGAATFSAAPGQIAYYLQISLACGVTYSGSPGNNWQNGTLLGATGMSNFLATSGATFDLAFAQHEPGRFCTTPIDCPFEENYRACLRHYCKSSGYATLACQGNYLYCGMTLATVSVGRSFIRFPVEMAKAPTMRFTGTNASVGWVLIDNVGNQPVTPVGISSTGLQTWNFGSAPSATVPIGSDWDAASGW